MNKRRLKALIKVLEKVPPKNLDMTNWFCDDCGTTACAAGHFAMSKSGKRVGFEVHSLGNADGWPKFSYNGLRGADALREAFDLDSNALWYIFMPSQYGVNPTPKHVIQHVQNVLKGKIK